MSPEEAEKILQEALASVFVDQPNTVKTLEHMQEFLAAFAKKYIKKDSYSVVCDSSNNSEEDRKNNVINVDIVFPNITKQQPDKHEENNISQS